MIKMIPILLALTSATMPVARANLYTIQDLEILASESNYEEFFAHAQDIRPSERLDKWKELVSQMSEGFAKSYAQKAQIKKEEFDKIEKLFSWPHLKSDSIFKEHRNTLGMRYLSSCLKSETPCWEELKLFWDKDNQDPDLGQKIAELIKDIPNARMSTWSFLENSLKSPLSEFYCKKKFVQDEAWNKLKNDYNTLSKDANFLKIIDETLHPDCLSQINKLALERLYRPTDTSDREFAFQFLDTQGKAQEPLKDFFYTVYLLENPSKGELFNFAWNRLNQLNRSSLRRDKVIDTLKKIDPLPDQILTSMDELKKKAILNHFRNNFPEYFQLYGRQCVKYYTGDGLFPYGNPTMNCSSLMKSSFAQGLVGQELVIKFNQATTL